MTRDEAINVLADRLIDAITRAGIERDLIDTEIAAAAIGGSAAFGILANLIPDAMLVAVAATYQALEAEECSKP